MSEPVPAEPPAGELLISNEFSVVIVRRVQTRNGVRLSITSPKTQRSIELDALELESLTWPRPGGIGALLGDPLAAGAVDEGAGPNRHLSLLGDGGDGLA